MHQYLLWLSLAAYAVHVLEEAILNWKKWAITSLKLTNVEWAIFDVANLAVMFTSIATAMVGWQLPEFALIVAALMLINGIFFHILPTIIQQTLSPGVITATILFLPIGSWIYYGAYQDGVLSWEVCIISLILGGLLMASPIIFLKLREKLNLA